MNLDAHMVPPVCKEISIEEANPRKWAGIVYRVEEQSVSGQSLKRADLIWKLVVRMTCALGIASTN
jgi:hypothetical protein